MLIGTSSREAAGQGHETAAPLASSVTRFAVAKLRFR